MTHTSSLKNCLSMSDPLTSGTLLVGTPDFGWGKGGKMSQSTRWSKAELGLETSPPTCKVGQYSCFLWHE